MQGEQIANKFKDAYDNLNKLEKSFEQATADALIVEDESKSFSQNNEM